MDYLTNKDWPLLYDWESGAFGYSHFGLDRKGTRWQVEAGTENDLLEFSVVHPGPTAREPHGPMTREMFNELFRKPYYEDA